jgi:hypothetical protein
MGANSQGRRNKHSGARSQQAAPIHRWLSRALDIDGKGSQARGKAKSADVPLGCQTPHGATLPDSAAHENEGSREAPFLRVAGFGGSDAQEDDRWHEDDGYDFVIARCDHETPLGFSPEHCARFDTYDSSADEQQPQAVLIRGLPNDLGPVMQVVLEQAGLKGHIVDWHFQKGQSGADTSETLVWLSSRKYAEDAVWHFHGCCWAKNNQEVTACCVETHCPELTEAATDKVLDALLAPPEEWLIDPFGNYVLASLVMEMSMLEQESSSPFARQRLATIWEEKCSELAAAEASTDAGASGTSVASEAENEDCHEGDDGSDS